MSYIWPQLSRLNWFGLWPADRGFKGQVHRACSRIIVVWCFVLFSAELFSTHRSFQSGDLVGALVNLNEFFPGLQCYVATLVFVVYRRPLEEAMVLLDELSREVAAEMGEVALKEFARRKKSGQRAYNIFFATFLFVCYWAVRPLMHLAIYGERTLILHSWVPFHKDSLLSYIGNFMFQLTPALSFCFGYFHFFSLFVFLSEMILGNFAVLGKKLDSMVYGQGPMDGRLANCVSHHTRLLRICSMFQDVTASPLIAQCILTVLTLCTGMFELTIIHGTGHGRLFNVVAETQQHLMFLATFSWYGNEITFQCLELMRPGYMANWYEGTKSEKTALLNIMTRTTVPIHLGGFIKVDILTCINIVKAAFSYYSFLTVLEAKMNDQE